MRRLLILGGTAEAAALARQAVAQQDLTVITALAGRTRAPAALPGVVRVGGFGGPEGLALWLERETIDAVVDATHPFAARISANAATACGLRPTPRLLLARPPWQPQAGDIWTDVADMAEAAAGVPSGARAFLAIGRLELAAFAGRADVWFLLRLVDSPEAPPPLVHHAVITGRGPFLPDAERALLTGHRIDCVVTKNSGGGGGRAKLDAARALGLPVIVVRRPEPPPGGARAATVAEALAWLARDHLPATVMPPGC